MLSTYRITDDPNNGIELVGYDGKKILSGNRLGHIVAKGFHYKEGIFAKHNMLRSQEGLKQFVQPEGAESVTHSKLDWVMLMVEESRSAELSLSTFFHVWY
jgi:hypothetical protein